MPSVMAYVPPAAADRFISGAPIYVAVQNGYDITIVVTPSVVVLDTREKPHQFCMLTKDTPCGNVYTQYKLAPAKSSEDLVADVVNFIVAGASAVLGESDDAPKAIEY